MAEERLEKGNNSNGKKNGNGAEAEIQPESVGEVEGKEVAELKDRLLRMAAEFDNYRKRAAKDIDGAKALGRADAISRLLPTLDEFELALEAFGNKGKEDEHMKGIALVYSNLLSTLKGMGLREISSDGKSDPYKHEIVLTQESDKADGSIIEVVRKGYMLNEIMLRPASVIVSRKGVEEEKQNEEKKKEEKGE